MGSTSRGSQSEIAEIVLNGFAMPGRHSLGQFLESAGLLARRHASPFLDQLAHLDGIDAPGAAARRQRAVGHGLIGVVPRTWSIARLAAVGATAVVGRAGAGFALAL